MFMRIIEYFKALLFIIVMKGKDDVTAMSEEYMIKKKV